MTTDRKADERDGAGPLLEYAGPEPQSREQARFGVMSVRCAEAVIVLLGLCFVFGAADGLGVFAWLAFAGVPVLLVVGLTAGIAGVAQRTHSRKAAVVGLVLGASLVGLLVAGLFLALTVAVGR